MERKEWLKQMRDRAEALYDLLAPEYWITFGLYPNETHLEYLRQFLDQLPAHSHVLSAACGAGRYDGMLVKAGHTVLGIDQSAGMLNRARLCFPDIPYEQIGLQEMDFRAVFDGAICMDALENVCPEDWPGILQRFQSALKPGGLLYFTLELPEPDELDASYLRAKTKGLPVVYGELADAVEEGCARLEALGRPVVPADLAGGEVYHYYPSKELVLTWLGQAGLAVVEQSTGKWYEHFVVRK
jgi:SAM-dependent methyltransferase